MRRGVDIRIHALAFLYDHLSEFPVWVRALTPGQMEQIAKLLTAWHSTLDTHKCEVLPLAEVEKRTITHALALCNGSVVMAAKALAVGKTTLYRKIKSWGYSIENRAAIHQAAVLAESVPHVRSVRQHENGMELNDVEFRGKRGFTRASGR